MASSCGPHNCQGIATPIASNGHSWWSITKSLRTTDIKVRWGGTTQMVVSLSLMYIQLPLIGTEASNLQIAGWPYSWEDHNSTLESNHQQLVPTGHSSLAIQLATLDPNSIIKEERLPYFFQVFHSCSLSTWALQLLPCCSQESQASVVSIPTWQKSTSPSRWGPVQEKQGERMGKWGQGQFSFLWSLYRARQVWIFYWGRVFKY